MKKLLSLTISLMLIVSMFSTVSVSAATTTKNATVSQNEKIYTLFDSFLSFQNDNVYEEEYYVYDMKYVSIMDLGASCTDASGEPTKMTVETDSSGELDLSLFMYRPTDTSVDEWGEPFGYMFEATESGKKGPNIDSIKVSVSASKEYVLPATFSHSLLHQLAGDENLQFVVSLTNYDELKKDAKVTIKMYSQDAGADTFETIPFAEMVVEFEAPVNFNDEKLGDIADILEKAENGETYTANDLAAAINSAAEASDTTDFKNYFAGKEDLIDTLNEKLNADNYGKVEDIKFNELSVSIPFAKLAGKIDANNTYKPEVTAGNEYSCSDEEIAYSLNISLSNGTETISSPLVKQKVVVELPISEGWDTTKTVKVLHGTETIATGVSIDSGNKVEFWTDSFSPFTIVGTKATPTGEHTEKVKFTAVQHSDDPSKFDLVITPTDNKEIYRYTSGAYYVQLTNVIVETPILKALSFDLEEAQGIEITNMVQYDATQVTGGNLGGFSFVASSADKDNKISLLAGQSLKLATLTINGTGKFKMYTIGGSAAPGSVNADDNSSYIHMETKADNGDKKATIEEDFNDTVYTIPEKTANLTLNLDFTQLPLSSSPSTNNKAEYLGISVVVKNEITKAEHTFVLGNGTSDENTTYIPYDYTNHKMSGTAALVANAPYSFVVKGDGFRTFRGSVTLDGDKTVNIWNYAKENENGDARQDFVINGLDSSKKAVTFLVGDIYEDGIVDVYDLSAVVSYYNTKDIEANSKYVAYDLNRDGRIDITDVAWVQHSYSK